MTIKKIILITLVFIFSGCAQPLKKQAFNKEASPNINSFAIAQPQNQEQYSAIILAHPGQNFGLIGGLIAAADMKSKSDRLTAAIDAKETRLQERFMDKLSASLSATGYQTQIVKLDNATKYEMAFDSLKNEKTDGLMTVEIFGEYIAAGAATDYFPYVVVKVKSVDATTSKIIYQDVFTYGYNFPNNEMVNFSSAPEYRFKNIEELTANPEKTRKGLLDGIDAIVAQITSDLKKN